MDMDIDMDIDMHMEIPAARRPPPPAARRWQAGGRQVAGRWQAGRIRPSTAEYSRIQPNTVENDLKSTKYDLFQKMCVF